MGFFEFSWATITLIDIGVISISVIGLWWLKNQVDEYRALSEELEKRYNTLHHEHETLGQEYKTLGQEHETLGQEHKTLRQEHETLGQEHKTLRQEHETLQQEFRNFQSAADRRYNALQQESEERYKVLQEGWIGRYNTLQQEAETQYNTLQEAYDTLKAEAALLRTGLETVTQEHKILERRYDTMAGKYEEISDKFTLILEKLADRN